MVSLIWMTIGLAGSSTRRKRVGKREKGKGRVFAGFRYKNYFNIQAAVEDGCQPG